MKTKFFKKLSLVLVVAMVLSLFVPAVGAFAASSVKLNATKKYLHLGRDDANEFNFNIKSEKKTGWKYFWESSNEDVAEVNSKNGVVTATGVGTAKITVTITDKDKELVDKATATVVVRDNIEDLSISNPVEKLAVGAEHDYNRGFVTESGSKKKTSSIVRWEVSPAEGATIDDKGVFVATAAGEYTVIARAFQSKAKYADWLSDAEKYASYVLDTAETKVVVNASIVGIKQIDQTQFKVEFDSSMKDTDLSATTATVYQVINGKLYNTGTEKIKSINLDADGKVATVEIYGNLVSKTTYQFVYGDLKDEFTAADTAWSEIAGIVFDDFEVKTDGTELEMLDKVSAVNADGVVIKSGADLSDYLTFDYDGDFAYGWLNGTKISINKNGYTAKITVKYSNFVYDDSTKTYKEYKFEDQAVAVGVDVVLNNNTMQYAVAKAGTDDSKLSWKNEGFTIPASDDNVYEIYTRFKKNTDPSWVDYTVDKIADNFNYVSTNSDKLVIDGYYVFGITPGTVTVLVQDKNNKNTVVGAFDITIVSSRSYAEATVDKYSDSLGNFDFGSIIGGSSDDNESVRFTVTNKDTIGDLIEVALDNDPNLDVKGPSGATAPTMTVTIPSSGSDFGKAFLDVDAAGATKGSYQFKVALRALNVTKNITVFVNVLESEPLKADGVTPKTATELAADVKRWAVEFDNSNVNLKEQEGELNVGVKVYGYNKNNARVYVLDPGLYTISVVKSGTSSAIKSSDDVTSSSIPVAYFAEGTAAYASGKGLAFVDLSSYTVTAKVNGDDSPTRRSNGANIATNTFKVDDTTELVAKREKTSVSEDLLTVADAIKEAYSFKIKGETIDETTADFSYKITKGGVLSTTDGSDAIAAGQNVYVHEIYYTTTWDGGSSYVRYTFKIGQTLTITK